MAPPGKLTTPGKATPPGAGKSHVGGPRAGKATHKVKAKPATPSAAAAEDAAADTTDEALRSAVDYSEALDQPVPTEEAIEEEIRAALEREATDADKPSVELNLMFKRACMHVRVHARTLACTHVSCMQSGTRACMRERVHARTVHAGVHACVRTVPMSFAAAGVRHEAVLLGAVNV
eukprot:281132-Chlamydomonas_euryale.AAC.3